VRKLLVLLPPELFLLVRGKERVNDFLAVSSIYRNLEVCFLFGSMMYWVVHYLLNNNLHHEDMLWLVGLLAEELVRFTLLLMALGCLTAPEL
jgi:hypothetical protein